MTPNRSALVNVALFLLVVGGGVSLVVFWPEPGKPDASAGAQADWTCSMHPQVRLPKPGQCPICGMDLIPAKQLGEAQASMRDRVGLETEMVAARDLFKEIRTVGKLEYNEGRVAYITARIAGRVDRVYADFAGIPVKKDDHLVDIYSPDLFIAQGELFRALDGREKTQGDRGFAEANVDAARTKLRLLGILPEQLAAMEKSRKIASHLTIFAPIGGTVVEKSVRAGQYVKEGDMLYRIADLDPIWLYLDIYEADLAWVRYGQAVEVRLEAYPAETFRGFVTFIDPFLDDKTRTVKARVNLKNPERRLKPAMYASAVIRVRLRPDGGPEPTGLEGKFVCTMHPEVVKDDKGECPLCGMPLERVADGPPAAPTGSEHAAHAGHAGHQAAPTASGGKKAGPVLAIRASAVLDTGRRKAVYRQRPDGAYELVDVQVGPRTEGQDDAGKPISYYPILSGLKSGDRVVVRGGFLLDSQRQIEGMPSLLYPEGQSAANLHSGHGDAAAPARPTKPAPTADHSQHGK